VAKARNTARPSLTQSRLKEVLSYDPEAGEFRWLVCTSNRAPAGSLAGSVSSALGYRLIGVDGVRYFAHRLAWLYMTGSFPAEQIDHANADRSDNRWANLRAASKADNMRNIGMRSDNGSGHTGVGWHAQTGKWRAYIAQDGRTIHLGLFDTKDAALAARNEAAAKAYGEFHIPS
jgi:hypothetical protein